MGVYQLDINEICFPNPKLANKNGLLAVGGDLSCDRLLLAYMHGIFPWYNPWEEILWWCPKERFLIYPDQIHISKSMKKFIKQTNITIVFNGNFRETMHRCRVIREDKEGSWISDEMEEAYETLFQNGYAISVEAFEDGMCMGGLYGVSISRCFFGESMFSYKENGSKVALIALANYLKERDFLFIDCQFHTKHLESMGGQYVGYEAFEKLLSAGRNQETVKNI